YDAGFNSSGRFYEKSTDMLGMTPSRYRAGGANEEIKFAVGQTSLGAILVASTNRVLPPSFSEMIRTSSCAIFKTASQRRISSALDRKSTRLNSSHVKISYAVFCLKKKKI